MFNQSYQKHDLTHLPNSPCVNMAVTEEGTLLSHLYSSVFHGRRMPSPFFNWFGKEGRGCEGEAHRGNPVLPSGR